MVSCRRFRKYLWDKEYVELRIRWTKIKKRIQDLCVHWLGGASKEKKVVTQIIWGLRL